MAEGANEDMGRCILTLYRDAAQPAAGESVVRLRRRTRPPALFDHRRARIRTCQPSWRSTWSPTSSVPSRLPLDGCGHWWMFEEPGLAADGLVAFWSGLD